MCAGRGYRRAMDEARAVIRRLERIETLERDAAPADVLLEEVRALLREAEAWVRVEPDGTDPAENALERCRNALNMPDSAQSAVGGLW
jgi:hypothetical protein